MKSFTQPRSRLMLVSILAAILFLFVWKSVFWGWVFDDAYIVFRFSNNWATGNGLTWNPGEDPVEGFTSFAWVLIGTIVQRVFRVPPHISMILIGIASWFVLMAFLLPKMIQMTVLSPKRDTVISSSLLGLLTVLALLLNPYLGFNAFHGLETALHILFFAVVVYFALQNLTIVNGVGLVIASLFSVMIRPDALAFILPLWGVLFVYSTSGNERRTIITGFTVLVIALGLYSFIKWQWFGYPVPNTFYIKQGGLLSGLAYVNDYVKALSPIWLFFAFAAGRAGVSKLIRDKTLALLLLPALVFCFAYIKPDPIMGDGYRFLIPTLPLITLACLRAYALSETQINRPESIARWKLPKFLTEKYWFLIPMMMVSGLVMLAVSFLTDAVGLGAGTGFGQKQMILAVFGSGLLLGAGVVLGARQYGWVPKITEASTIYLLMIFSVTVWFGIRLHGEYGELQTYFKAIEQVLVRGGHNLKNASTLSPTPLLATGDVGAIPYFSKLPTMDIIGLTDETVAHEGLTHEYIMKRKPDLLILQDLYLSRNPQPERVMHPDYSNISIQIDGVAWPLDMDRYITSVDFNILEKAHHGAGSTFQVVTTPSFTSNYIYVTDWDFAGKDRYYAFVRKDYAQADELVKIILQQGRQSVSKNDGKDARPDE